MITTLALVAPLALWAPQETLTPSVVLNDDYELTHRFLPWPTGTNWQGGQVFGPSAAGEITLFGGTLALVCGQRLFLVEGVESMAALTEFQLRTSANMNRVQTVAISEGEGPHGLDLLVTFGLRYGAVEHVHDPSVAPGTPDFASTTFDGTTAGKRVTAVTTADVDDNDGGRRVDLVCAKENTIRVYRREAGAWVVSTPVTATGDVNRVIVCDYDGFPGNEYVTVTSPPKVYGLNGTLLATIPVTGTVKDITALPPLPAEPPFNAWDLADRLAIAYEDGGESKLVVRNPQGVLQLLDVELTLFEGSAPAQSKELGVTHLLAGDVNLDGLTDLVIGQDRLALGLGLHRAPTGGYSIVNENRISRLYFERQPQAGNTSGNVGQPAVWRAGRFSRNTFIAPVETLGGPFAQKGVVLTSTPTPTFVDAQTASVGSSGGPILRVLGYGSLNQQLHLLLTPPGGTVVDQDDKIFAHVTYWHQPDQNTDLDLVGGAALCDLYGAEDPSSPRRFNLIVPLPDIYADDSTTPALPEPPAPDPNDEYPIWWVYVRIVEATITKDGTGQIATLKIDDSSEWTNAAFRLEPDPAETSAPYYDDYIKTLPDLIKFKVLQDYTATGGGTGVTYGAVGVVPYGGPVQVGQLPSTPWPPWLWEE